jgi:hypothetical protein
VRWVLAGLGIIPQACPEKWQSLKSPFEKGGFRGISSDAIIPPDPPLEKGGKIGKVLI